MNFSAADASALSCTDWRGWSAHRIAPLLDREARRWADDLPWDHRWTFTRLEEAREDGRLPGAVASNDVGGAKAWTYFLRHLDHVPGGAGVSESAPATTLNLFLAGTIAGPDPVQGWAIIGENAQSARVVATGSSLAGGAVLKAVYPDRVVLELGGRLESLMLPRLSGAAGVYPARAASSDAGAMIDAVRNAIGSQAGMARIGEIVRPQPVFANGALRGVRAYPGANRQLFMKLGLQPGDLVTAINGAQLDNVQRATETLRNLGSESVQLTVIRHDQARQVSIDPAAVARNVATDSSNSDDEPPIGEP